MLSRFRSTLYKIQSIILESYANWNTITRWKNQYNIDHTIWPLIFTAPFKVCRETCLQSFQYWIIHRILPCYAWLYVRKVLSTNHGQYVYFTNTNLDDISNYLVKYLPVSSYWESFVTWRNTLKYLKLNPLTQDNIILGFPVETLNKNQKHINLLKLLAI